MSTPTITSSAQAFIDGDFVDARSGETFDTLYPGDGGRIATVAACGQDDVDLAIAAARDAFDGGSWSRIAPAERKAILLEFAARIESSAAEIARLDAIDAGKPITDCVEVDVPDVVATIRWYAEAIDKQFGKLAPTGESHLALITREPVGVVGAVLPWNFPAMMLAWKMAPALAAGNSVVIKPAELSPLSALRIAELGAEAGIPAGALSVVPGLGEVAGRALGRHMDVDVVTFTGSTEVGREFLRYSADSNLKKIVLECGGKSPQIVMADAAEDLAYVAGELASAAFWNSGQNCTCGSRILVQRSVHDDLVDALARAIPEWPVGSPLDPNTRLGPLIEPRALERVLDAIGTATEQGATVAAGGHRVLQNTGGWFIEPTILDDVRPDMPIAREEIFGPVVAVLTFDTEAEAAALANDSTYGLAASVFTRDIDCAHRLSRQLRAGTVAVNCYGEGDISTPFGGYKQSGFGGRDKGIEALEQYTELKTTWIALRSDSSS